MAADAALTAAVTPRATVLGVIGIAINTDVDDEERDADGNNDDLDIDDAGDQTPQIFSISTISLSFSVDPFDEFSSHID